MKVGEHLQKIHPERNITSRQIELLGVAGLVHDIGHGPFSHLYDHYVKPKEEPEHEERGLEIFRTMCEREALDLSHEDVETVCEMINPSKKNKYDWYYQVIANKSCQLDVDKMDYIQRDSFHLGLNFTCDMNRILNFVRIGSTPNGEELVWDRRVETDVFMLFFSRYKLHSQVYTHHTVKAFEYVVVQIMKKLSKYHKLSVMSDAAVTQWCYQNPDARWAVALMERKHPKTYSNFKIIGSRKEEFHGFHHLDPEVFVDDVKIGFVSGEKKNPLSCVHYFNSKDPDFRTFRIEPAESEVILPKEYQQLVVRMYSMPDCKDEEKLQNLWNQVKKQYGIGA